MSREHQILRAWLDANSVSPVTDAMIDRLLRILNDRSISIEAARDLIVEEAK